MSVEHDAIVGVKCDRGAVNGNSRGGCFLKKRIKAKKVRFDSFLGSERTFLCRKSIAFTVRNDSFSMVK